jgi:Cu/Zn superoxide dismutase
VARFRKTAIAALAASALLLTPTAAYADHKQHRGVSTSSEDRGMTWAYSDRLIDYETDDNVVFKDADASAVMIGMNGRSYFRLRVTGIKPKDDPYGVHLHAGVCDAKIPGGPGIQGGAGPHYNVLWHSVTPPLTPPNPVPAGAVSNKNEVWLDLDDVDRDGDARSTATVSFIPEGPRSIVIHEDPTAANGSAGARLACLPFNINVYGN